MWVHSRLLFALGRLGVRQQLLGAFSLMLLLTGLLGGASLHGLSRVNDDAHSLSVKWLRGLGQLADARALVVATREHEVKYSKTDDKSYQSEYREKMDEAAKSLQSLVASYGTRVSGEREQALLDQLIKVWGQYRGAQLKVVEAGKTSQSDAADFADGASSMLYDELITTATVLIQFNNDGGRASADEVATVYQQARALSAGLLLASVALGLALALLITRRLLQQLGGEPATAVQIAKDVAQGKLTTVIDVRPGDQTSLLAWLQTMQRALTVAVSNVRQASEGVSVASSEIAQGNLDLSSRTEQQASALQQTAATMDELGSTVRNNADNARQASELATGACQVAARGGAVVGEVVETMKGINDSSRRIADIIGTIDGIAFQTNILALNAAVEAARAGEQGRGFAVVASEVRNLAQRSAEAAREIKLLIHASVDRVAHGSALVGRAGSTMTEIVDAIRRVTDIVSEISLASTEQSVGVTQVGRAVAELDRSTQQNAALVEQSAAAADSLKLQADRLVDSVAVFKLDLAAAVSLGGTALSTQRAPARSASATKPHTREVAARQLPGRIVASPGRASAAAPGAGAKRKAVAATAVSSAAQDDWESF